MDKPEFMFTEPPSHIKTLQDGNVEIMVEALERINDRVEEALPDHNAQRVLLAAGSVFDVSMLKLLKDKFPDADIRDLLKMVIEHYTRAIAMNEMALQALTKREGH